MKKIIYYALASVTFTVLPTVACRITIHNDLNDAVLVMDGVKGDTDTLPIFNPPTVGNDDAQRLYRSGRYAPITIAPGQSATVGREYVHAHFLLGLQQPNTVQWYELAQYQCTGKQHETLKASQIVNNNFGKFSKHFGAKKL